MSAQRPPLTYYLWQNSAKLPAPLLTILQSRKIQKICKYAATHTKYYEPYLSAAISNTPLSYFPVITRRELQKRKSDMVVANLPPWMYRNPGSTSGSTGEPATFFCSTFDQQSYENEQWYIHNKLWRFLLEMGYSICEVVHKVRMVELRAIRASNNPQHLYLKAENAIQNPTTTINAVLQHQPMVFGCYGSFTLAFCKILHDYNAVGKVHIPYIVNTGEVMLPEQRKFVEETLGGEMYNRYGMEEFYWTIACEDSTHDALVSYAESYVIEILDDNDVPVPVGHTGRVVVTDLNNFTMPLIRYDTGDLALLIDNSSPRIRFNLIGRNNFLSFGQKKLLYYNINYIFSSHAYAIAQYQFIKRDESNLILRIVKNRLFHPKATADIQNRVKEVLGEQVNIRIEYVPEITRSGFGKTKVFFDATLA